METTKMSSTVIELMNSRGLWIIAIIIISIVIIQTLLYVRLAFKSASELDFPREKCIQGLKAGMIASIGPAIAVFVVMVGMMSLIGGPVTWMWLTMIGSADTKLTAARLSAEAMGVTLGSSDFSGIALANTYWAMSINGVGWLLVVGFMTHRMERVRQKIGGGDQKWLTLFGISASISAFAYLNVETIYKSLMKVSTIGSSALAPAMAVMGGIIGMMLLQKLGGKYRWLRGVALGISMVIGICTAIIVGGI